MKGLLSPRTGTSERKTWPIARAHDRVALGGAMFVVACFKGSGPWWFGRDSLTIQVTFRFGTCDGCCSCEIRRGIEMCVLNGVNTRSLTSSGCESFTEVRYTGFMDGDYLWRKGSREIQ